MSEMDEEIAAICLKQRSAKNTADGNCDTTITSATYLDTFCQVRTCLHCAFI